ncbi:glycine--tRNA ligase alpha subunit [Bacteroidia bacterium]|nr:glycine--tRNA ligase alpha subunit [Bacteroidia bacterium]
MLFQELKFKLHEYWNKQGCSIMEPHDVEKGAGTMNPNTFLAALGSKPYRRAYIEPSRRPADGRYGDNPNRLYQHTQYQVILKPSPIDVVDLYIKSLEHISFKREEHDIRFVEDNWESPTLGAFGKGWEVWLDGMEISQFTFFQVIGGFECKPVTAELTYGLERIAMYLQNVDNVYDLQYSQNEKYGDIYKQREFDHSKYSFENCNKEMLFQDFENYAEEVKRLVGEYNNIYAAYDFALKCSHTFNVLDACGAISKLSRNNYIQRIQGLFKSIAKLYISIENQKGDDHE